MPFHSFVGQVEAAADRHPLERLAREVLLHVLGMSAQVDVGSSCSLFFGASFVRYIFFIYWLSDYDIVLAVELVEGGGILFIDEILFLELKFELVLPVGFDWNEGDTE